MIHYDLVCENGHCFDGWFAGIAAFEQQSEAGLIACPVCESQHVQRQIMKPAIAAKDSPVCETAPARGDMPMLAGAKTPEAKAFVETIREMRRKVEANADYVGKEFASEARKIHYEEAEPRSIYGEATLDDAKSLLEEGVEVHPLPVLPEEKN